MNVRKRGLTPFFVGVIVSGVLLLGPVVAGGLAQSGAEEAGSPFARLGFREIGPATPGGRVDDLAVFEKNPAVFYVATATGGLWKTVNNGTTFEPVFDHESTSSIGDVAIAPADPNVVWVGTGENNNRQSSSWGEGVFKSTDGGTSWKLMGSPSRGTSRGFWSTRWTPTSSTWRPSAACGGRAATAASTRRPTAA